MRNSALFLLSCLTAMTSAAQSKQPVKKTTPAKTAQAKYGALAIDRSNGFYYGWSFDYTTRIEAEQKAVTECRAKGGDCSVVLVYSGTGCAAYRTIDGNAGTAYGWGVANTKEEADAIAMQECLKRSNGVSPGNYVWSCNDNGAGTLKELYNASEEIAGPVQIGNQVWMNRNLDVATFSNGDPITQVTSVEEWERLSGDDHQPAWCYYAFDAENGRKYGKLYNWFAVNDPRGLAPQGWRVPTRADFNQLISYAGGDKVAGPRLRSKAGWTNGLNGTNDYGFNLLPNGEITEYASTGYRRLGSNANLWCAEAEGEWNAYYLVENENYIYVSDYSKTHGYGIRLIKE